MDKNSAEMENISYVKAVNLWMIFPLVIFQNFYIFLLSTKFLSILNSILILIVF